MTTSEFATLRVTQDFEAAAERVFAAWVDPAWARRWLFATATGAIVRCDIDARAGGRFTIVDRRNGEDVEHHGEFEEVDAPRRLSFTFSVPKFSAASSRVNIDITPSAEGGCRLTLAQEGVPREWAAQTEQGWRGLLADCARLLAS